MIKDETHITEVAVNLPMNLNCFRDWLNLWKVSNFFLMFKIQVKIITMFGSTFIRIDFE